jgi:hypothetical protein
VVLLDRLNYHEAWIGEHHSGGFEIIACPELFIAGAAERTRHIRLGLACALSASSEVPPIDENPLLALDRDMELPAARALSS